MRLRNPNKLSSGRLVTEALVIVGLCAACGNPPVTSTPDDLATMGAVGTRVYLTSVAEGTVFSPGVEEATNEGAAIAATMNAIREQVGGTLTAESVLGTPTPMCFDRNAYSTAVAAVSGPGTREALGSAVPVAPECTATPPAVGTATP